MIKKNLNSTEKHQWNSYASTGKTVESQNISDNFLLTLVIAFIFHARIKRIWFCSFQIFGINQRQGIIKGYSRHFEMRTLRKMEPRSEIKLPGLHEYLCFETSNFTT